MTVLDTWRADLPAALGQFLPVMKMKGIDLKTGVLATAVLWPVRHAADHEGVQVEIKRICGENALPHVIQALPTGSDPLAVVQLMSQKVVGSPILNTAVDAILAEFVDEIVAASFLKETEQQPVPPMNISTGNIDAVNVVIGGKQYVFGDMVLTVIHQQEAIRTCPTPPAPPAKFGGRQADYERLKQAVKAGTTSAIAGLRGVGGIGKTTLARQLAHDLYYEEPYFKAVVWTDVHQQPDLRALLISWAQYSDQNYSPDASLSPDDLKHKAQQMLADAIRQACGAADSERVLVVLDDVWEDGIEAVRTLIEIRPHESTLLITTRSATIAGKLAQSTLELQYMTDDDAADMLQTYLEGLDSDQLKPLAQALGGHPLALKLAAENILEVSSSLSEPLTETLARWTAKYAAGIPAGSPFVSLKLEEGSDKEDNLTISLALSYDALPADEDRARFRALGVLPPDEPFDDELLAALWQASPEEMESHLVVLRRVALLDADKSNRKGWYGQHRLLRAFARALLIAATERDMVFRRYAEHVTNISARFLELQFEEWRMLDPYLSQIHAVGDELAYRVVEQNGDMFVDLAGDFSWNTMRYLNNRQTALFVEVDGNRIPQRMQWFDMGLIAWRQSNNLEREAMTLNNVGGAWSDLGEQLRALEYYEKVLPLTRVAGNPTGEVTTLTNMGTAWNALGEPRKALKCFDQALSVLQIVRNHPLEAATLSNIGMAWSALGQQDQALKCYEQALLLCREVRNRGGEAATLNNMGMAWSALGNQRRSLKYYEQALFLSREVGDLRGEAMVLDNVGNAWANLAEPHRALAYFEQALPLRRAVGDRGGEGMTLNNMAMIWSELGEQHKALMYYEEALVLYRAVRDRAGEATVLNNIAMIWSILGDQDKAFAYCEQALPIFRAMEDRRGEAKTLNNMGFVWSALGDPYRALERYEQALPLKHDIGDQRGEATTLNNIGGVWSSLGDQRKALAYYEQALSVFRAIEDRRSEAITLNNIGGAWNELGERRQGLTYYEQALLLSRAVCDRRGEAATCFNIGMNYSVLGELGIAIDYVRQCVEIEEQIGDPNLPMHQQTFEQLKSQWDDE
jgi:tetratricopeptide (TPR) repeat protein